MLHERTARRRWLSAAGALLAAALLGVLAGVLAKAADESGRSWAADLGSYPAAWVLAVALLGWSAPTWAAAVSRSAVFFAAMTVAYYAWAAEVLDFGWDVRLLVIWLLLSVTAVPATAVAVWWVTRRAGVLPGALLGLAAGTDVVVDAVFPVGSRRPFRELATRHGVPVHWFRLICADPAEHHRRVEQRVPDLPGHVVPDWSAVRRRDTDQWHERHTVVDTASGDPVAAVLRTLGG